MASLGLVALSQTPTGATAQELNLTTVTTLQGAVPTGLTYHDGLIYGAARGGSANSIGSIFTISDFTNVPPQLQTIHIFTEAEGAYPNGSLAIDSNRTIYGTTSSGGAYGYGTVFKIPYYGIAGDNWPLVVLHNFTGGADGGTPLTGVTLGADGSIYGTTSAGGGGTFFRILPNGSFVTLYTFKHDANGNAPLTNVAVDPTGVVIGAVSINPVIVQDFSAHVAQLVALSPSGALKIVAQFQGVETPTGDIVRDSTTGNVYGVASYAKTDPSIWRVTAQTHVLSDVSYDPEQNGGVPNGLFRDNAGNFYMTTRGTNRKNGGLVLTAPAAGGQPTILATLGYANQGPLGGVIVDPQGRIFGTSAAGGTDCGSNLNETPTGCGTVFMLSR